MKKHQLTHDSRELLKNRIDKIRAQQNELIDRMEQSYLLAYSYDDTELSRAVTEVENLISDLYHDTLMSNFDIYEVWTKNFGEVPDASTH